MFYNMLLFNTMYSIYEKTLKKKLYNTCWFRKSLYLCNRFRK